MRRILIADQLIDGTGAAAVPNGALIVEDGRIEAVTTRDQIGANPEGEVIELAGGTITPGFIEVHAHMHCSAEADAYENVMTETHDELLMRSVDAVRTTLTSGVTTMRDLGSRNEIAFPIKKAILDGKIPGPRLLVTGTPITTTAGHCNSFGTEADTEEQVITALRRQIRLGADYIKMMSTGGAFTPRSNVRAAQYPVSTLRAAVEDAERMGVRVAAHCHGTVGVANCTEAGIHNLIHSTWLSENPDESWDYKPEVADAMAEKGLWVDPTIAIAAIRDVKGVEMDPGATSAVLDDPEGRYAILRDMWDRGVKFVTGLDTGMAHVEFGDFAFTPQVMVEGMGISEMEAIVSSSKTSAECLDISDETGTLVPGKSADALIINGDPLADIRTLHNVDTIVSQGDLVKRGGQLRI
jgi:imidazolonepropionase-like amidohydrolase